MYLLKRFLIGLVAVGSMIFVVNRYVWIGGGEDSVRQADGRVILPTREESELGGDVSSASIESAENVGDSTESVTSEELPSVKDIAGKAVRDTAEEIAEDAEEAAKDTAKNLARKAGESAVDAAEDIATEKVPKAVNEAHRAVEENAPVVKEKAEDLYKKGIIKRDEIIEKNQREIEKLMDQY